MRAVLIALAATVVIIGPAYARPEWADPVRGMTLLCRFLDVNYIRTPCTASGSRDLRNTWRQHLGTDFAAPAGSTVVAPVTGKIVLFDARPTRAAGEAFLVIKDAQTGEEHVIGHISSSLANGADVVKGRPIGSVKDQGRASHVHWGFNLGSVQKARQHTSRCLRDGTVQSCPWGWGKAPYEATESEVRAQGWRNVL